MTMAECNSWLIRDLSLPSGNTYTPVFFVQADILLTVKIPWGDLDAPIVFVQVAALYNSLR